MFNKIEDKLNRLSLRKADEGFKERLSQKMKTEAANRENVEIPDPYGYRYAIVNVILIVLIVLLLLPNLFPAGNGSLSSTQNEYVGLKLESIKQSLNGMMEKQVINPDQLKIMATFSDKRKSNRLPINLDLDIFKP